MTSQGKPARSAASIRASLEALQTTHASDVRCGPRPDGVLPCDPIIIATFASGQASQAFQQALSAEGIPSSQRTQQRRVAVSVDSEDSQRALEILKNCDRVSIGPHRFARRSPVDFLMLGGVGGGTLGVILVVLSPHVQAVASAIALTALGCLLGHLLDRLVARRREFGRARMGLREWLLSMAVVALVLSLGRLLEMI